MTIFEYLGPTPPEEECAQTLDDDFSRKNLNECTRFKKLLEKHSPAPEGCSYEIKLESEHDFGPYREVVAMFDHKIAKVEDLRAWSEKFLTLPTTWKGFEEL